MPIEWAASITSQDLRPPSKDIWSPLIFTGLRAGSEVTDFSHTEASPRNSGT